MTRNRREMLVWVALRVGVASLAAAQGGTTPEERLKALGIGLPPAPKPVANYVPAVRAGTLVFLAGQGPLVAGRPAMTGRAGGDGPEKKEPRARAMPTLNPLPALRGGIESPDRVRRIVKLTVGVKRRP